ncbi:hypothetical protein [Nocardioides sp. URHA0020]|uniref:hypothetical protein n=1 Tax=Nocardioides sp. URHA0020 TaxID=1380392 RepID=UPI00048DC555|nr:hypothetical protein [Nocardioides sp. URHA0020]
MSSEPLAVQVIVNDPWEFTTEAGTNVFSASVLLVSSEAGAPRFPLVVRLEEPIRAACFEGTDLFVVTAHERSMAYSRLLAGEPIESGLTGISKAQAEGVEPFDTSSWRGQFPAARATLRLP